MTKMLRDEKGRFAGREVEPEIRKMINEENEFVEVLLDTSRRLKVEPETVGLRKGCDGRYHVSYFAVMMFMLKKRTAEAA